MLQINTKGVSAFTFSVDPCTEFVSVITGPVPMEKMVAQAKIDIMAQVARQLEREFSDLRLYSNE